MSSGSFEMLDGQVVEQEMVIMPLGGGQEVGRSCILLKYRGRTILLDCGIHPGREGMDSCPFFDMVEPETVDLILISHFHIDHCASLPYFTEKTNFKGRIFMTHATKAVMRLLVSDFIKLLGSSKGGALYSESELISCIEKIEVVDYHHTIEHKGIKFCGYAAGHVLGAAMFTINIDGVVVLYTGDYSMEEDRHLLPAEIPHEHPDVLIVESTYGTMNHSSREERETRFTATVERVVRRGGNCLIPVFALGRAQELLLILDEYWKSSPDLHDVPIFYASRLASKALRVYQTFVNMMNLHIQALMDIGNPFHFAHIENMGNSDMLIQIPPPCVVMASPGMLQSGVSRQLFERWCEDERNGVVLAGYSVEGTLAKKLLSEPEEITCLDGRIKKRNCAIEYISFSAHVDYIQNTRFIRTVVPDNIILVHGEPVEMGRLKSELDKDIARSWPEAHTPPVVMPRNGLPVTLSFTKQVLADVVGTTATSLLQDMKSTTFLQDPSAVLELPEKTILVTEDFKSKLVTCKELGQHTSCRLGRVQQRMTIPLPDVVLQLRQMNRVNVLDIITPHLEEVFDEIQRLNEVDPTAGPGSGLKQEGVLDQSHLLMKESGCQSVVVQSLITIEENLLQDFIIVSWIGTPLADMVADCALGVVYQSLSANHYLRSFWNDLHIKSSPQRESGTKRDSFTSTSSPRHSHGHGHTHSHGCKHGEEEGSRSPEEKKKREEESQQTEQVIKRMKLGLLDPSQAFKGRLLPQELHSIEKNSMPENRLKLEKIWNYLKHCASSTSASCPSKILEVLISQDGLRLIVRGFPLEMEVKEDSIPIEAYIYIHWSMNRGHTLHHAVVQCLDDQFRKILIALIQQLETDTGTEIGANVVSEKSEINEIKEEGQGGVKEMKEGEVAVEG